MPKVAFEASMFELVDLWAEKLTEDWCAQPLPRKSVVIFPGRFSFS